MSAAALRVVPAEPLRQVGGKPKAAEAPATPPPIAMPNKPATRLLRMLSGPHTGAESELRSDRLLIGNLESECDVVIDVSRPERHLCLVRASHDGWTVLSIAGDLWIGDIYLAPQQTHDIASGLVLTLGRVAFCIADSSIDWSKVKPPIDLIRPDPTGPIPTVALLPAPEIKLRKWHALKLAAGIGVASLTIASAGAYLTAALAAKTPTADEAVAKMKADQALVTALPFGKELELKPEPTTANRVQVHGYLPKREQARALEKALRDASIDADYHLVALDELGSDIVHRFERAKAAGVRYENKGRFVIDSQSEVLDVHDRQARQTLQELPALSGLNLSVADIKSPDGKPIVIRYDRSVDRPGDIVVSELDVIRQRQRLIVKEVRPGAMPSIVLDNGMRYFEGATLPDKSVLKRIGASELVVMQGSGERTIPMPADTAASAAR
jgi:Inner membrane component of T3SS, cytoplasmic domain